MPSAVVSHSHTYREHFKDLQPVGGPAFLGFVDWQREVDISGILREEQHQEDRPASEGRFFFLVSMVLVIPYDDFFFSFNTTIVRIEYCNSIISHYLSTSDRTEPIN